MLDFTLPLFPFDSTAITISATVWVGVLVAVFFNLRLGWTLSGLVVPGYLVPLMMARPVTAAVICVEAFLTYMIVLAVSEWPRQRSYWSSFFGRDRFFVILLVSVLVRAVLDGFVLPWAGRIAVEQYGINFDYRNNLHSFGLIVVALIANYFWKPGALRGFPPLATCIAVTYIIVQCVLIRFTNFNVGNIHLLYDDVTTSLLASPKAYILVLTTAYVASWMNLRYAWDFNGILIPALLGLMWHDPIKIVVSAGECMLLCVIGSLLLRTPIFRKMTVEGSTKIAFFFTICFFYRLALCHVLPRISPEFNLTDAFGYGYLLSTLMAIKIHDKNKAFQLIIGTSKVSMVGAVIGSLIGFGFVCAPPISLAFNNAQVENAHLHQRDPVEVIDAELLSLIRADKTLLYEKRKLESYQPPMPSELALFRSVLREIKRLPAEPDQRSLSRIATQLHDINYRMSLVSGRYVYLRERSPARGWGIYVIDLKQPSGLLLQVPAPMDEWATIESGLSLLQRTNASALSIAGSSRRVNIDGTADVVNAHNTFFETCHQAYGHHDTVQVRGYTRSGYTRMAEAEGKIVDRSEMLTAKSRLYVRGEIPSQLRLSQLKLATGGLEVRWNNSPLPNRLRDNTYANFVELILNRNDRRRLVGQIAGRIEGHGGTANESGNLAIVRCSLRDWLKVVKEQLLPQGTDAYVPAKLDQMLYMDLEVFAPLMRTLSRVSPAQNASPIGTSRYPAWLTQDVLKDLALIDDAAQAQGYGLAVINDDDARESYVVVSEFESDNPKGWGAYVFRPGLVDTFAVEIPRPMFERRSFDFGVNLFERPRGAAMLIAGAHPRANLDGSADISKPANRLNLFNLVRHVLLRHLADRPFLITQARAIQAPVEADIVIATDDGATSADHLSTLKSDLLAQLAEDRLSVTFVDGSEETAGYELGILMQATSVQVSQNKEVISLWLSPSLRTKFREQTENNSLTAQFESCSIASVEQKLTQYLSEYGKVDGDTIQPDRLPDALRDDLLHYVRTLDVVRLNFIVQKYSDWTLTRIIDSATGQAFLALSRDPKSFPTILNLTGSTGSHRVTMDTYQSDSIRVYVRSRALWLQSAASSSPSVGDSSDEQQPRDVIVLTGSQS